VSWQKKLFQHHLKEKSKLGRIPRAYLPPAQFDQYASIFREYAGEDGILDRAELQGFFVKYNITVSPDRLKGIMDEVDDDKSGTLGETEFLILLIKALGPSVCKKRKIGPGLCDLKMLKDEGWSKIEIKSAGYKCAQFIESGYSVKELLPIFTVVEFAQAGVPCADMMASGWDCRHGKESGYSLHDFVIAGVTTQRIRDAGFDDLDTAVALRAEGITALKMKTGGWPLSTLQDAGYTPTELRLAGYSMMAVASMGQLATTMSPGTPAPA